MGNYFRNIISKSSQEHQGMSCNIGEVSLEEGTGNKWPV
jgi:hypothetical protein